jgi:hypothetical protein
MSQRSRLCISSISAFFCSNIPALHTQSRSKKSMLAISFTTTVLPCVLNASSSSYLPLCHCFRNHSFYTLCPNLPALLNHLRLSILSALFSSNIHALHTQSRSKKSMLAIFLSTQISSFLHAYRVSFMIQSSGPGQSLCLFDISTQPQHFHQPGYSQYTSYVACSHPRRGL